MYKSLITILAVLAIAVAAPAADEQKTIKDQEEYSAYMTALSTRDPAEKAEAMVAFVEKYPDSVVRIDAREQAMAAYQQTGNEPKLETMAQEILKLDPANIRALAIVTFIDRTHATTGDKNALIKLADEAKRGLAALSDWKAPDGISLENFHKLRDQMAEVFNGAAGFVALQKRDYATARDYYLKSVQLDSTNLQDVYQLAVADLESKPVEPDGFWYIAKAADLAGAQKNVAAEKGILAYAKSKYRKYHGGEDGWDKLAAAAADQTAPPKGFAEAIKRAPTPAETNAAKATAP